MDILSVSDLKSLAAAGDSLRLSLFMPTFRKSTETRQNPIRFKNLLGRAEERLQETDLTRGRLTEMLAPLRDLEEDHDFWQNQGDGLALFRSQGDLQTFRLPFEVEEAVFVGERAYIKPLLPAITDYSRFYVLALSQNQARLVRCTPYSATEVEVQDMPESLAAALRYTLPQKQLQFHTGTGGAGGAARPALFHGQGVGTEDEKTRILEYFREIDKSLRPLLEGEGLPLVPAGVEFLFPIYREANSYENLAEGVAGNPDHLTAEQLRERAWEKVQPALQQRRSKDAARFQQLLGTGQASNNPAEVAPAAWHGRVDTLWVSVGARLWGRFDPARNQIEIHDERQQADDELLDLCASRTLVADGTVYGVQPEEMPEEETVAAVFRY